MAPLARRIVDARPGSEKRERFLASSTASGHLSRLEQSDSRRINWDFDDGKRFIELSFREIEGPSSQKDSMWWGSQRHPPMYPQSSDIALDPDARNRVILLAKKYARQTASLSKEDDARLEMFNQTLDLQSPRYSVDDFRLLEEAEEILREIESIRGK